MKGYEAMPGLGFSVEDALSGSLGRLIPSTELVDSKLFANLRRLRDLRYTRNGPPYIAITRKDIRYPEKFLKEWLQHTLVTCVTSKPTTESDD